jgi:hypothetical protein
MLFVSLHRPWILFEAGMAKGKLETPILGVALGVSLTYASSGPFAQFQNCEDDEVSLTKLVRQLIGRIPNSDPDDDTIKSQVSKFKASVAKILKSDKTGTTESIIEDNSSAKLFEEIKVMFKELTSKANIFSKSSTDTDEYMKEKTQETINLIESVFFSIAKPATQKEIRDWEIGFNKTHGTSKEIDRSDIYFVDREVIIPPLHGAKSISIIVEKGVRVHGTHLHSHNEIYYLDGFRTVE